MNYAKFSRLYFICYTPVALLLGALSMVMQYYVTDSLSLTTGSLLQGGISLLNGVAMVLLSYFLFRKCCPQWLGDTFKMIPYMLMPCGIYQPLKSVLDSLFGMIPVPDDALWASLLRMVAEYGVLLALGLTPVAHLMQKVEVQMMLKYGILFAPEYRLRSKWVFLPEGFGIYLLTSGLLASGAVVLIVRMMGSSRAANVITNFVTLLAMVLFWFLLYLVFCANFKAIDRETRLLLLPAMYLYFSVSDVLYMVLSPFTSVLNTLLTGQGLGLSNTLYAVRMIGAGVMSGVVGIIGVVIACVLCQKFLQRFSANAPQG